MRERERGATAGSPGVDTGRTAEHGRPADVRGVHLGPATATVNRRQLPRTNIITNAITLLLLLPLPYHRNACVDNRFLNVNHERRCEELSGRNRRTERGRRVPSGGRRNLCRRVSGADNMCGTLLAASGRCLLYCRRGAMKCFTRPRRKRGKAGPRHSIVARSRACVSVFAAYRRTTSILPSVISIFSSHSTYPKCPVPYALLCIHPLF